MESIKDLMPQTPDLNAERVAKLKELFPDLFTGEGQLNEGELRKLVDPQGLNETERYEFRWFGKSQSKRDAFTPSRATLVFDEACGVNPQSSENLIIEGENLEVLKLLLCAYREEIKCIYIDPPYNTGKDFVYSDNYAEGKRPYWEQTGVTENGVRVDTNAETDGRFHSNWMNMMYSRLLVARQLLKPDGVIFISIDDNEVHNLRRICDEVFGKENFVASLIWHRRQNADSRNESGVSTDHEYVLVYSKQNESVFTGKSIDTTKYKNPDNDPRGAWASIDLSGLATKDQRPNLHYEIVDPATGIIYPPNPKRGWSKSKERIEHMIERDEILFPKTSNGRPREKKFINSLNSLETGFSTILNSRSVGFTTNGTREVTEIFGERVFSFPKSTSLVLELLKQTTVGDDITLDFFAGSGVTGQAVMELNEEDGGNRKFILVQLPELTDEKSEAYKAGYKKISDITIERNKRVVASLVAAKREAHPNLFEDAGNTDALKGLGFKVLRLEKSYFPRADWSPDPALSEEENVRALKAYIADKESQLNLSFDRDKLLTEILLKEEGFKLNYNAAPYAAVTSNQILHVTDGDKEALICLDPTLEEETVKHFKSHTELKFICLERALDTTKKWNLHHFLGEKFKAF